MSEHKTTILEFANNYKKKWKQVFILILNYLDFMVISEIRCAFCAFCAWFFYQLYFHFYLNLYFFFHFKYTQPQGKTTDDFSKTKFAVFIYQFNQFKETFDT